MFNQLRYTHRIPPSIYAVFPSIMASDGCNQIGKGYGPITTSFAPGELSTIEASDTTNVYNFSELPCAPSGIEVPPGETYAPLLAPPSFLYDLDPAFSACVPAYVQGVNPPFDPPIAVTSVKGGLRGPDIQDNLPPRRDLGAYARPHAGASGPAKTAEPKHKIQL